MSKAEENKAKKRARIIDAATRLFAQRGYHGCAVPLVAAEAKVGAGTIYRFFESKEALVNVVFQTAKSRLRDTLLAYVDLTDEAPVAFAQMFDALYTFARKHEDAFRFLELQDHGPYLDSTSRALELQVSLPISTALTRLQIEGVFAKGAPLGPTIAMIFGAFVGVMKAEHHGYFSISAKDVCFVRDTCWRALATPQWQGIDLDTYLKPTLNLNTPRHA